MSTKKHKKSKKKPQSDSDSSGSNSDSDMNSQMSESSDSDDNNSKKKSGKIKKRSNSNDSSNESVDVSDEENTKKNEKEIKINVSDYDGNKIEVSVKKGAKISDLMMEIIKAINKKNNNTNLKENDIELVYNNSLCKPGEKLKNMDLSIQFKYLVRPKEGRSKSMGADTKKNSQTLPKGPSALQDVSRDSKNNKDASANNRKENPNQKSTNSISIQEKKIDVNLVLKECVSNPAKLNKIMEDFMEIHQKYRILYEPLLNVIYGNKDLLKKMIELISKNCSEAILKNLKNIKYDNKNTTEKKISNSSKEKSQTTHEKDEEIIKRLMSITGYDAQNEELFNKVKTFYQMCGKNPDATVDFIMSNGLII